MRVSWSGLSSRKLLPRHLGFGFAGGFSESLGVPLKGSFKGDTGMGIDIDLDMDIDSDRGVSKNVGPSRVV